MIQNKIRLIQDDARSPRMNMAIDEMLMLGQSVENSMPVLRLYAWDRPAFSIGYFQEIKQIERLFSCQKKGIEIIRRISGGGLVTHGSDVTFSISAKLPCAWIPQDVRDSYLKINEALMVGLRDIYPKLDFADCKTIPSGRGRSNERVCFESPACYDLLLESKKIVGASQRRKNDLFLHQSAVFLRDERKLVEQKIIKGFENKFGIVFERKELSLSELKQAEEIAKQRYCSELWFFTPLDNSFLSKQSGQL